VVVISIFTVEDKRREEKRPDSKRKEETQREMRKC
jgi:hypothetical protein